MLSVKEALASVAPTVVRAEKANNLHSTDGTGGHLRAIAEEATIFSEKYEDRNEPLEYKEMKSKKDSKGVEEKDSVDEMMNIVTNTSYEV
jgi:hypothetical protein